MSDRAPFDVPSRDGELEVIKTLCRDLWPIISGHRLLIENLKTDHQGTYVMGWKEEHPSKPMVAGIAVGFLAALGIETQATRLPGALHLTHSSDASLVMQR